MIRFTAENNREISTTMDCLFRLVQARSFLAPPMVWSPTHVCSNVVLLVPPTTAGCRGHCHWEGCLTFTYRVCLQCTDFFRYLEKTLKTQQNLAEFFMTNPPSGDLIHVGFCIGIAKMSWHSELRIYLSFGQDHFFHITIMAIWFKFSWVLFKS